MLLLVTIYLVGKRVSWVTNGVGMIMLLFQGIVVMIVTKLATDAAMALMKKEMEDAAAEGESYCVQKQSYNVSGFFDRITMIYVIVTAYFSTNWMINLAVGVPAYFGMQFYVYYIKLGQAFWNQFPSLLLQLVNVVYILNGFNYQKSKSHTKLFVAEQEQKQMQNQLVDILNLVPDAVVLVSHD